MRIPWPREVSPIERELRERSSRPNTTSRSMLPPTEHAANLRLDATVRLENVNGQVNTRPARRVASQYGCLNLASSRAASGAHRVGGGVTPAVLPHHRTCCSASGGSWDTLESSHGIEQRHQPQAIEVRLREGRVHVARAAVPLMSGAPRQTARSPRVLRTHPSHLCLSDLRRAVPCKYRASQILACAPRRVASYPLPVRQASALPTASFRFAVARDTLADRLTLLLAE